MRHLPIEEAGDEVQARPRHTGHHRLDLVLALSAIFISAVSLYVAIEHGQIDKRLVAANSWPFLQISRDGGGSSGLIRYEMGNAGIGPAKLEHFEVMYKSQTVSSLPKLLELCCNVPSDPIARRAFYPSLSMSSLNDTVFRPGQVLQVIQIDSTAPRGVAAQFIRSIDQISFKGCYCSVFDECWTSNLLDLRTTPVASCPTGPSFNDSTG